MRESEKPKNPPSTFGNHLVSGDRFLGVVEWRTSTLGSLRLYYIWVSADEGMIAWENDTNGDQQRTYMDSLETYGWNEAFLKSLLPFLKDYDDPSVSPNARSRKARA